VVLEERIETFFSTTEKLAASTECDVDNRIAQAIFFVGDRYEDVVPENISRFHVGAS
jgi:hypothetical protein